MQVLLIAESSDYLRTALADAFAGEFRVHTCSDGHAALEMLQALQPDGLILDLSLAYKDGLCVLRETAYLPPAVMVLYATRSAYVLHSLQEAGVSYMMPIPCTVHAVRSHFMDLLETDPQSVALREQQVRIAGHLNKLGIPSHLNGYRMLCAAIAVFHRDPLQTLTKETYPAVSQLLGNHYGIQAIERGIRNAICTAWCRRDSAVWKEYFPKSKMPTNKLFISTLSQKLL